MTLYLAMLNIYIASLVCMYQSEECVRSGFSPVDEYWQNHPELHDIPIYYASSLAKKCMAVYQTYVNAMNDKIRKAININNPFVFKHISNLKVESATHTDAQTVAAEYLLTVGSVLSRAWITLMTSVPVW